MNAAVDVAMIPRIEHDEAMALTEAEAERFAAAVAAVPADGWGRVTPCTRWDVADLVAHVIGSAAAQASPREFVRQVRAGRSIRRAEQLQYWWDGMNEVQVVERRGHDPLALAEEWTRLAPSALRARSRLPRPIARLPLLSLPEPLGRQPVSYLFDMGFTRDTWMHRIDLADALDVDPELDDAHDGRIVADVVAEWAATHGEAFRLQLTGPGGGTYVAGDHGEEITTTVPEFARCLTERVPGTGLLEHRLPL